jgi:hypothetical protein
MNLMFLPLAVDAATDVLMVVDLVRGGGHGAFGYTLLALLVVGYAERNNACESATATLVAHLAPSWRALNGQG